LRFETLLSDISARFVNLPPDQVDREIEKTQFRICECLGFDRSSLWQISETGQRDMHLTHIYQAPDAPSVPGQAWAQEYFPWVLRRILLGETVLVSKLENLPKEAATDKESFRRYGTRSAALLPLQVGGAIMAVLSFAVLREEREWPEDLVRRLQLVAEVFANVLARKRSEQALQESEELIKTIFHSLRDKVIVTDKAGNVIVVNEPVPVSPLESPAEILKLSTGENFFEVCRRLAATGDHAADTILSGIQAVLEGSREHFSAEYPGDAPKSTPCFLVEVTPWLSNFGAVIVFHDVTDLKTAQGDLRRALEDVTRLQGQMERENLYLRQELSSLYSPQGIVGQSEAIRNVLAQVRIVAGTGSAVLLLGETGTGKGRIASLIHEMSPRRDRAMVNVNCAAIPETLIESELFGREKGAYTGAYAKKAGSFEFANGSTLFLDEVGELPLEAQAKLLWVLEEKKIQRLGSPREIDVDVRIIAASNRDMEKEVREGRFRADLYYRLNVFSISVPPLRERREDIPLLVEAFIREFSDTMGKSFHSISRSDLEKLIHYPWPGNVRELRNVIERAAILSQGPGLRVELPRSAIHGPARLLTMDDAEKEHIRSVLEMTGWQVGGKGGAAEILEMKPSTLRSRMAKLGLLRPGGRHEISR
ncbi:MAG TPA: sigma 54-interacting transcriptional regulator, partial [Candidatus Deferrimicrobiaceae bacterium]|nr:sigma 54-interacting transcriptional regulator [Candidatus Deferrimicrobiaceae bacterium]